VYTDWILIRRAAAELDARFRGARVRDAGLLADGRFALALWKRGAESLLCADLFAATPLVTVESGELPIVPEPGFVRAANTALRGTTVTAVRARRGDRILRIECGTRSRFGVESGASLVLELVPRFGNALLLKGDIVVSALKEFGRAENPVRAVESGAPNEPPPLPQPRMVRDDAIREMDAAPDPKERARLLRSVEPLLPQQLAQSLAQGIQPGVVLADEARSIVERYREGDIPLGPVFVYRDDGVPVQAHVVELRQYATLVLEHASELLPVFAEVRETRQTVCEHDRTEKRRRDLLRALSERETKLRNERERAKERLASAGERATLRTEGDDIYARLHELPEPERDAQKERAAGLFAKYKKLTASVEHLERRVGDIEAALDAVGELQWEAERARAEDLDDVAAAIATLEPHARKTHGARVQTRRRKPLQVTTAQGSRILVGRTPVENADLTFRVARPNDLWFHVQNQPGAHVILQRDDRTPPDESDIEIAAALAAFHSKAKTSPKVTVDYTLRKYVRKRPSAAPGLVFYTNPKSVTVAPRDDATR